MSGEKGVSWNMHCWLTQKMLPSNLINTTWNMILPKMSSSELSVHFRHYLKSFLQCKIRDKMLEDVMLVQQTLTEKIKLQAGRQN